MVGTLCVVLLYVTVSVSSQALFKDNNPCISAKLCGDCIAVGKHCAWCKDPRYGVENKARCNWITSHSSCPPEHIVSPQSILIRTEDKVPADGTDTKSPIQLQPQVINLKIRPNDPQNFTVTFRVANNYPVDLYYLMDLSYTMKSSKDQLANLAPAIANAMRNITADFRLGFGSFVDKPAMPYICVTKNDKSGIHCPINRTEDLDATYSFKNQQSLSDNPTLFQEAIRNAKMSNNLDAPEGGLDAVMQIIACENEIGWRKLSRRMLLYSSDSGVHTAGDGKLGGVIKPNDEECHLINNMYSESKMQDYPSVSQIASKINEKNVNLLFAVTRNKVTDYSRLWNVIPGSELGTLADDSSNIVTLVRQNYEKISSKVEMTAFKTGKNVNVRYFTKCKEENTELIESNMCTGLKVGDTVSFQVEITVTECPAQSSGYSQTFDIKPVGLSDRVQVQMEVICKCDCENDASSSHNNISSECSNHGSYVCGDCHCQQGFTGKTCNCSSGEVNLELKQNCKAPGSNISCSGQGQCLCGACECNERRSEGKEKYSGQFCECDPYSCPFYNGRLCGGSTHGVCKCGKCECSADFKGENCGCSTKTDSCLAPDGSLCGGSDRGECICNACVCKPESNYQGKTCEVCKDCSMICRQNKACVQCVAYGTGELKNACEQCKERNYISVQDVLPEGSSGCEFKDEDDCIFYFSHNSDENDLRIIAKRDRECPEAVNPVPIVLGILLPMIFLGVIALIVWKVLITIHDKRLLAEFEEEVKRSKWAENENPIYLSPITDFQNPTYTSLKRKDEETNKVAEAESAIESEIELKDDKTYDYIDT